MKEKTMPRQQTNKHQTVVFDFFSGFWFIFCVFRKISFNIQFFSNDGRIILVEKLGWASGKLDSTIDHLTLIPNLKCVCVFGLCVWCIGNCILNKQNKTKRPQ